MEQTSKPTKKIDSESKKGIYRVCLSNYLPFTFWLCPLLGIQFEIKMMFWDRINFLQL